MKKMLILLIICLISIGCSYDNLNKEKFVEMAEFNGYILEHNKEEYANYSYVLDVYYAVNRDYEYYIELLELESNEYANSFFNVNRKEIENVQTSNSYIKQKNFTNYNLYHVETDTDYMLVIRSNKLILYVTAPINYINEIEDFLNELNLEY